MEEVSEAGADGGACADMADVNPKVFWISAGGLPGGVVESPTKRDMIRYRTGLGLETGSLAFLLCTVAFNFSLKEVSICKGKV